VVAIKDGGRSFFRGGGRTLERDIAETDGTGTYVLDTLMQGVSYRLGVLAEGYSPIYGMTPIEIQDEVQTQDFSLSRAARSTGAWSARPTASRWSTRGCSLAWGACSAADAVVAGEAAEEAVEAATTPTTSRRRPP